MGTHEPFTIYIGFDSREAIAGEVLANSIRKRTKSPTDFRYLKHKELRRSGNFSRPWLVAGNSGEYIDIIDNKPFSTEYSYTRFLVPHLNSYKGWAVYCDSDMIFLSDIKKLFDCADDRYALMCVKHKYQAIANTAKLDGRLKNQYYRKNWSSLMLINCAHEAHKILTPQYINYANGLELHGLSWVKDEEIGELSAEYNYISGVSPKIKITEDGAPALPKSIHYTQGAPWCGGGDIQFLDAWICEYNAWRDDAVYGDEINGVAR